MNIQKNDKYTLITLKKNIKNNFFIDFKEKYSTFENQHLIVDISVCEEFTTDEIADLTTYSQQKHQNGTSFVVISTVLDAEKLEGIINVTPTLTEAIDIIEMEEIERDLGF